MKKRFTETQRVGFLRAADGGLPVKELCRKHGFSEASYYLWRSKCGGMRATSWGGMRARLAAIARTPRARGHRRLSQTVARSAGAWAASRRACFTIRYQYPKPLV